MADIQQSQPGVTAMPPTVATPTVAPSMPPPSITTPSRRRVKIFTVHGTFAHESAWDDWISDTSAGHVSSAKPSNFVNLLSDYLKAQNVAFDEADHTQYNWSGLNSHDERRTSAIGLKKLIEHELSQTQARYGKSYKDYYDGGVYVVAHSHGGTISRLAMNLWDKDQAYYGPEKRVDPLTKTVIFDELKHDDHCEQCKQERNGTVGPNTVDRPDCVITFGSPFVTFEERSGGLLAAKITVWSFRFLTLLPLLAYFAFMAATSAAGGAGLLGAFAKGFTDPAAGLTFLQHPMTEVAALLLVPLALYWLLASYTPKRFVVQVERWFGRGAVVNSVAAVARVVSLTAGIALLFYYVSYLRGGKPGVSWWLEVWNSSAVTAIAAWLLPLLIYWLIAISLPGRSLAELGVRVAQLRTKLPKKYDPREERQAFYLNYHTPGDEPGMGLRLQGAITWLIQTLALAAASVLAAGIVLAIIAGFEVLLQSQVMGGRGLLASVGLSPQPGAQQWRFIAMMDGLTAIPELLWNGLNALPGMASVLGGSTEMRLGGLANAQDVAKEMPTALFSAVMTMLFGLLPSVLLALVIAFGVGVWLRNSMAGFGAENFAWTLASRIAISKRAGPNSMLRKINISRDAWWNRDIAHCYYYKSDAVTKDVAHFIAHPKLLKPDALPGPLVERATAASRWLVVTLFILGIFAAAVPIAAQRQASAAMRAAALVAPDRERALKAGAMFQDCDGCPMMVVVPAGEFLMGSSPREGNANEEPRHKVSIAKAFAVSKMEVTGLEYRDCKAERACASGSGGSISGGAPATEVTWRDAVDFTTWLSKKTGKPYRLLTEAEWEYAARAGSTHAYAWGGDIGVGNANCKGCGDKWDGGRKAPTGSFKPNAFGLQDMHGNVAEWVEDRMHGTYDGAPADGTAWRDGGDEMGRVIRGGAATSTPREIRSAQRFGVPAESKNSVVGFRVARTIEP